MRRFTRWAAAAGAAGAAVLLWRAAASPDSALLPYAAGAEWITCPRPVHLGFWYPGEAFAYYAVRLHIGRQPESARLELRAFRDAAVKRDGAVLLKQRGQLSSWRQPRSLELAPLLTPGAHDLLIVAMNRDGAPAVWARSRELGLATATSWSARCSDGDWGPAQRAGILPAPPVARAAPSCARGLLSWLPLLAAVFAAAWLSGFPARAGPSALRWALVVFWALLGLVSAAKLRLGVGFDQQGHVDYINFLVGRHAVPLASDGWQMFQPPLYYAVGAAVLAPLRMMLPPDAALRCLRLLNMLAGAALVEVCARLLRRWWPRRPDLQCAGLLVAGLLPMNLALFQALGNEPLCSLLTALTLLALWRWLDGDERAYRVGAVWGAALLAKVSPLLLAPALLAAGLSRQRWRSELAALLATAALVCGWYYGWVWTNLGRPFVGGWDASRGIHWWQDPGLRVLGHFTRFGGALRQPVYAGLDGFWDALYSSFWGDGFLSGMTSVRAMPPWRYGLMSAGMWLALAPTALIALGLWRAARGRLQLHGRLAAGCVAVYVSALLWLYLQLPAYSAGKATYLGGLTPLFGGLAAAGLDALPSGAWRRAASAALAGWAAAAALAYLPS